MDNIRVLGVARLYLTVHGCNSLEEAHEAALKYIREFEGEPWEDCIASKWNQLGLNEYCVTFEARAEGLPRSESTGEQ